MKRSDYKRLGNYIREVDLRNRDLAVTEPMGININKYFMPSVANIIGTDLSKYKIVGKRQFACNLMHVGRDGKIPIAVLQHDVAIIVSPAYLVFEIIDDTALIPEYLMMWFRRSEFDRNAWFYTDADVRGGLSKQALFDMTLPVPSIEHQRAIVAEYEALSRRINLNRSTIAQLEATAQTLYRKMFVDDIDPEHLPSGWRMGTIGEYAPLKSGYAFKSDWWQKSGIPVIKIGTIENNGIRKCNCDFVDETKYELAKESYAKYGDIVIAMTGATIGKIAINFNYSDVFLVNQRVGVFNLKGDSMQHTPFLYMTLSRNDIQNEIRSIGGDSAQANVSGKDIEKIQIILPNSKSISTFNKKCNILFILNSIKWNEIEKLTELQSLLLAKMGQ